MSTDLGTIRYNIEADSTDLTRTESELGKFEGRAESAGKRTKALGNEFRGMATAVKLAAAAVGGLTFGRIIRDTASFEQAMLGVKAVSGATEAQFKSLTEQARELGATTVFTAQQAADAQRFLAQAGFDANQVLAATPGVLQLATAAGLDLAQAADLASNALSAFRLPVEQLSRVNDVLAKTAASSNTNVTQLGQALSFAAPIASAAGVSIEETAAAIGALGDAGLQSSRAGTGLVGVIRQLSRVTPEAERTLAKYGLTTKDVDVAARGLLPVLEDIGEAGISVADSFVIFGSEAGAAAQILTGASERVNELADANRNAEGAAKDAADILGSGLQSSIRSLNSAVSEAVLQMGDTDGGLGSALKSVIEGATGVISVYNGMLPQFARANDLTREQERNLTATAIALQSVATGVGVLGALAIALRGATIAQVAFNVAARANPYALLAAGAAAAAVAVIQYRNAQRDLVDVFEDATASSEAYEAAQRRLPELNREINELTEKRIKNQEVIDKLLAGGPMLRQSDEVARLNQIIDLEEEQIAIRQRYDQLVDARIAADRAESERMRAAEAEDAAAVEAAEEAKRAAAEATAAARAALAEELAIIQQQNEWRAVATVIAAEQAIREERERSVDEQIAAVQRRVEATVTSLMTAEERERRRYQESLANLEAANDQELDIIGGYQAARERLEQQHQDRLNDIRQAGEEQNRALLSDSQMASLEATQGFFGNLAEIARAGGKDSFETYKALASIEAGVAASLAVVKALGSAPPPFNVALATSIGALAAVQIAQIQSAEYTGARAMGGQVQPGESYLVGERGPEVITMGAQQGFVTPNHSLSGGDINSTNVFQITTGVTETVQAEVMRMAPMLAEMSKRSVQAAMGGGGQMSRAVRRRA